MLALHLGKSDFKYRYNKFGKVVYHDRKKGWQEKTDTFDLCCITEINALRQKRLYIINNAILIQL